MERTSKSLRTPSLTTYMDVGAMNSNAGCQVRLFAVVL